MGKKKSKVIKTLKIKENKTNYFPCLMWTVMIIGVVLRLALPFFNIGMSGNEYGLAANILSREYWGLFNPLDFYQTAPPLFLCVVKLFTTIFHTDNFQMANIVFRLVSLLAGILSIFAFYHLLTNLFVNRFVILTGLMLFAFNPALINYSYELKPYSTDVLICILLIFYFIRYNPDGHWRQFIQTLLVSMSIMFSLPAVFVITGGLTWILVRDYRKFFYALSGFCLFMVFYFVYHLWGVLETNGAKLDYLWTTFFVTQDNILSLGQIWVKYNLNLFFIPLVSLSILGAGCLISFFRDRKIGVITVITSILLLIPSYLHLFPLAPETCLFLIPIAIILICQFPDLFAERFWLSKIFPTLFLLLVGYNLLFTNTINKFENNMLIKNRLEPNKFVGCELIYRTKLLQKNIF